MPRPSKKQLQTKLETVSTDARRTDTRQRVLEKSRGLLQSLGFHGFSFQTVADQLKIKKPSLFDHYKNKEELGVSLIQDYEARFAQWIQTFQDRSPLEKLDCYFDLIFRFSQSQGQICPMCALSAELHTLPKPMQSELRRVQKRLSKWIESMIDQGKLEGTIKKTVKSTQAAEQIIALALGSQMTARISQNPQIVLDSKKQIRRILEVQ